MPMNRRIFVASAAALTAPLGMPSIIRTARAATRLVVASLLAQDKPETLIWTHIRDRVEAELPGEFAFNIVPNAALGGEKQVVEGIRLGSVQASLSTFANLSTWTAECQIYDLPFLFRDAAHLRAALDADPAGLRGRLAGEGIAAPAFVDYGARHLLARQPITGPADLAGKRMRVIQSPLHAQLWEGFGALPLALPITEAYNALATGHVDAMDLTKSAYAGFRLHEVAPHVTETAHIHAAGAVIFSSSFWSGLDARRRSVFEEAATTGARHFDTLMRVDEEASVAVARAGGAMFRPVSDRKDWERPARAVWDAFADRVGGMDRILAMAAM
jgi:TRAP-type transport system periplasmic protein